MCLAWINLIFDFGVNITHVPDQKNQIPAKDAGKFLGIQTVGIVLYLFFHLYFLQRCRTHASNFEFDQMKL